MELIFELVKGFIEDPNQMVFLTRVIIPIVTSKDHESKGTIVDKNIYKSLGNLYLSRLEILHRIFFSFIYFLILIPYGFKYDPDQYCLFTFISL